jgi:glycerol-3-phosphate dehydrogenase
LLTVEGGKYTTSRNLAENVLKTVSKKFGRKAKSVTTKRFLAESEILNMNEFIENAKAIYNDFPAHTVDYLARMYGTKLPQVMDIARSDKQYAVSLNADGEMPAQALYAIREEMACTLMDILIRRTGIGTLGHPGKDVLERTAQIAAGELDWEHGKMEYELEEADRALSPPK